MERREAVERIIDQAGRALIIYANGMVGREAFAYKDREENFYMVGSMGLACSIGLGVAMARPDRRVIVVDGDGNALMNLGGLAMVGDAQPRNLIQVVLDNERYDSTGGQRSISDRIALDGLATAAGYAQVTRVTTEQDLDTALNAMLVGDGPSFLLVKTESQNLERASRVSLAPEIIAERFAQAIEYAAATDGFAYHNPVEIRFGMGICVEALKEILGSSGVRVGLLYGQRAMKEIGVIDAIKNSLPRCRVQEYGSISPNPESQDIEAALDTLKGVSWVIGIGGGSVLDVAKSVAFMANQEESLKTFLAHKNAWPAYPSLPYIAIPTTSGTGSEVTPWATIWDFQRKKKHSLSNPHMFPRHAIVDPLLTMGLSPRITACTGYDALCHAVEAFWSRHANPVSDVYAIEAVRLSLAHLEAAVADPKNKGHRAGLAKASLYAGMAFSNTKTTAVHAVSYPMTLHFGVAHGAACALTLAEFWLYNMGTINPAKLARLLAAAQMKDSEAFAVRLKALANQIGLPTTLAEAGIPKEGIGIILDEGFHPERVTGNPRELTRAGLKGILERIYD